MGDPWDPGSVTCRGAGVALGSCLLAGDTSLQSLEQRKCQISDGIKATLSLFMAAQGIFNATGQPQSAGLCLS